MATIVAQEPIALSASAARNPPMRGENGDPSAVVRPDTWATYRRWSARGRAVSAVVS